MLNTLSLDRKQPESLMKLFSVNSFLDSQQRDTDLATGIFWRKELSASSPVPGPISRREGSEDKAKWVSEETLTSRDLALEWMEGSALRDNLHLLLPKTLETGYNP